MPVKLWAPVFINNVFFKTSPSSEEFFAAIQAPLMPIMRRALLLLLFTPALVFAQNNENKFFNGMSIYANGGTSWMLGDMMEFYAIPNPSVWNKTLNGSFRLGVSRWLMDDLGIKLKYQYGQLRGGRQPGPQSWHVNFETQFHEASIMGKYSLISLFSKKTHLEKRWYADFELGVGVIWWRSFMVWTHTNGIKDYVGYTETPNTLDLAQKNLLEKDKMVTAMTLPVGFNIGYRINYKTDINFEGTVTSAFTDDLDTWNRSWSALDKYAYAGLGVTYNFNRSEDDLPPKRRKKKKKKDEANASDTSASPAAGVPAGVDVSDIQGGANGKDGKDGKNGLFGGKRKSSGNSRADDMLEIQLKMYELQLKLFEMQYLLNR